jgi:hypothetical protein
MTTAKPRRASQVSDEDFRRFSAVGPLPETQRKKNARLHFNSRASLN